MTAYDSLEVHVELGGETVFAGHAQFHRNRGRLSSTTFQYDAGFLAHPQAYALDPALDLVIGTQQTDGLPGAFSDAAPDRWGRNLIAKRERALARAEPRRSRTLDDVDFLIGVSDVTRQGAIRFRLGAEAPFLDPEGAVPKLVRLPELMRAAEAASRESGDAELSAVKLLLAAGTGSLGGARPKASVVDEGRQLIAKFPHHEDKWDVMAWEATALDLAAKAGVSTPPHRLVEIGGRHVLLLDRFDRRGISRIGYMSAMSILERRDGEGGDYVDIAERLEEVSARAKSDARELFRRVAVSIGINNTDDHLRNHGFIRERAGWVLSPAFDINPNPDPDVRQTTVAGADQPDDEAEGLRELGSVCRMSDSEIRGELLRIAEVLDSWQQVATSNGVTRSELADFADSIDHGVDTLRRSVSPS